MTSTVSLKRVLSVMIECRCKESIIYLIGFIIHMSPVKVYFNKFARRWIQIFFWTNSHVALPPVNLVV